MIFLREATQDDHIRSQYEFGTDKKKLGVLGVVDMRQLLLKQGKNVTKIEESCTLPCNDYRDLILPCNDPAIIREYEKTKLKFCLILMGQILAGLNLGTELSKI